MSLLPYDSDMTDAQTSALTIPADTQAKFGELLELIKGSESMNDEERQYWINLLPVMTEEQIGNLREILGNEKTQLAAIDEKYGKELEKESTEKSIATMDEEKKKKKAERASAEEADRQKDGTAEDLLKQIES